MAQRRGAETETLPNGSKVYRLIGPLFEVKIAENPHYHVAENDPQATVPG
ncbi:MAG: hypothetical protein P3W87_004525 [Gammaproteobacteria bacterium]|nr:hypothetical protein [Gammaproteobacteria bacterium]